MTTNQATGDLSRSLSFFFSPSARFFISEYREIRDNSHLCNEEILYVYFLYACVYDTFHVFARSSLFEEGGISEEGEKEDGPETPVAA